MITQEKIQRLIAGRKLIDDHKNRDWQNETDEQHTEATLKMIKGLADLGFEFDEFEKFNTAMCYDEYKDKTKIEGSCDKCEGLNDTPSCVKRYGDKACYYAPEKVSMEDIYKNWYQHHQKKTVTLDVVKTETLSHNRVYTGRPEGCGFYANPSRVYDFDIDWFINK